jgi:hypothetical protein
MRLAMTVLTGNRSGRGRQASRPGQYSLAAEGKRPDPASTHSPRKARVPTGPVLTNRFDQAPTTEDGIISVLAHLCFVAIFLLLVAFLNQLVSII